MSLCLPLSMHCAHGHWWLKMTSCGGTLHLSFSPACENCEILDLEVTIVFVGVVGYGLFTVLLNN